MYCAAGLDIAKECLPGTRKEILSDIINWANSLPDKNSKQPLVYWLTGPAGSGKSAIASSIAHQFRGVKRCAPFFTPNFSHVSETSSPESNQAVAAADRASPGPWSLFSTLSRELADLDPVWRQSLVDIIKGDLARRSTGDARYQFENFILGPAQDFRPTGPILVVIDGLDRCAAATGREDERAMLLEMIAQLYELEGCGHLRFLITSRSERADIRETFEDMEGNLKPWVVRKDLVADVDNKSTDEDIRRFVDAELSGNEYLAEEWPDSKPWVGSITRQAEHSFLRAYVACDYVKGQGRPTADPVDRFEMIRDEAVDLQQLVDKISTKF
jgi:hypothetical protein